MRLDRLRAVIIVVLAVAGSLPGRARADYATTNLVSDIPGLAPVTDPNLRNPWGVSSSPTSPFWVSDQATGLATLYNGAGAIQGLTVTIPSRHHSPERPETGQVWNGNANDFKLANGNAATFLFANLNGQISAWNSGSGTTAQVVAAPVATTYTGLAIGQVGADNVLFAADSRNGKIDVYDASFSSLNGTSYAGKFADANLAAAGYRIFNAQTIGSNVYVTYSSRINGGDPAISGGAVAVFDLAGNLIRDFSNGPGGPLEDPWGVTLAPSSFGEFGGDLLVGDKESGRINAFDPTTGAFLGLVTTVTNDPTSLNNGLWSLTFGNGGSAGSPNVLYAFAGINNEADGLIVAINPVPEPASSLLTALGGVSVIAVARARRRAPRH